MRAVYAQAVGDSKAQQYVSTVRSQQGAGFSDGSAARLLTAVSALDQISYDRLQAYNQAHFPTRWASTPATVNTYSGELTNTFTDQERKRIASTTVENAAKTGSCSYMSPSTYATECILIPLGNWIGSLFLILGVKILVFAGTIFDKLTSTFIIDFAGTLSGKIMLVINAGWSLIRDISNIFLIGIFIFIAISLILGLQEFGQKKLIARVLIIAILMNFSLLFAKIIIDISNFIAYSAYSQMTAGGQGSFSVSDGFLRPMQVSSLMDGKKLLDDMTSRKDASGFAGITFGFFAGILLLVIAMILLYGSFLIVSRAITLLFIMISAPLAFTSYLVPNFENAPLGWKEWWKSLINNAAFAPLLMIFLAISIKIVSAAAVAVPSTVHLSAVVGSPEAIVADGWTIFLVYLLGAGLLFVSMKLAHGLAGSIGGFKLGHIATALPFAMGSRALGFAAQRTIGKAAAVKSDRLSGAMSQARIDKDWTKLEQLRRQKATQDKRVGSSFNFMNTGAGKALAGATGLKGALSQESKGSYKESLDSRAKEAEERAKTMQITADDKAALAKQVGADIDSKRGSEITDAKTKLTQAETELTKAKNDRDAGKDAIDKERVGATQKAEENRKEREPELKVANAQIVRAEGTKSTLTANFESEVKILRDQARTASAPEQERLVVEIATKRAAHASALSAEDNKIKQAREQIQKIELDIDQPLADIKAKEEKADKEVTEKETAVTKVKQEIVRTQADIEKEKKSATKTAVDSAEDGAREGADYAISRAAGRLATHADIHYIGHHVKDKFKKKSMRDELKELLKGDKKDDSH